MHRISLLEEKTLLIRDTEVRVQKKKIKSLRLRLLPPRGEVRLSVPYWYSYKKAEDFILSRWDWIEEQKKTILSIHPLARQSYFDGERILFKGRSYTLHQDTQPGKRKICLTEDEIHFSAESSIDRAGRIRMFESWYRERLKEEAEPLFNKWGNRMQLNFSEWRIKKMSSRWGSCNTKAARIWLNLELITMKPEILEYVIVHELAHLLEPSHNKRFKEILSSYFPQWKKLSRELKGEMEL